MKLWASHCRHEDTVTVRSTGMVRTVCEDCGHVSFTFDVDRDEPGAEASKDRGQDRQRVKAKA